MPPDDVLPEGALGIVLACFLGLFNHVAQRVFVNELKDSGAANAASAGDGGHIPVMLEEQLTYFGDS